AVIIHALSRPDGLMRIVAGNATHPARTPMKATTPIQLLHVIDGPVLLASPSGLDKDRPKLFQGQAGPKIEQAPSPAQEPNLTGQMTLLTHRLAQGRLQVPGINNGIVRSGQRVALPRVLNVPFAGSVTTLTANGMTIENRRLVMVLRTFFKPRPIRMTKQAHARNGPFRERGFGESWRD